MRYLKLYEDFSSDKKMAAFSDILWDKGHEKNPEMSKIMDEIEDPDSEEGEMWSDSERKRLDDFLSGIEMPDWKPNDPIEKKITDLANSFKSSIGHAKTTIESSRNAMELDNYAPSNPDKATELEKKLVELEGYLDEMNKMDGWWTGIRSKLGKNPSLAIEAKSMIDLVDSTCKQISKLQDEASYTYQ